MFWNNTNGNTASIADFTLLAECANILIANKNAATLARELIAMSREEFSARFKGSPMKRAKLRGLQRNASVVLGNIDSR